MAGTHESSAFAPRRPARAACSLLLACVLGMLLAGPASAQKDSAARKLGRGMSNVTLGVLALPREVYHTTREDGPFIGITWGTVKGVFWTVSTELVGVWETLTCPFEMPADRKPILAPEFPWQGFDERPKKPVERVRRPARHR